jgi:saccharopine dehydrogenase (NAD+, L-lysine forming)
MMKVGILREGKMPPDRRVPLTPIQCAEVQQKFTHVKFLVQPSAERCYRDEEYRISGIKISEDLSGCDVLLGVKEVPPENLIPEKTYLFFSHTIKKQEYNRVLLQTILGKKIRLIDYEILTDNEGFRIIGFGRIAGIVGAYNGIRALGLRTGTFFLKPAHECENLDELFQQLNDIKPDPVKIAVTGHGRVANGTLEVLETLNVKKILPQAFLQLTKPGNPCYTQLLPEHYVRRKNGSPFNLVHFFEYPDQYENAFLPYARSADLLISAAYWDPKAPVLFTKEQMRQPDFRIKIISDITCDIEGSIPSTKRPATIDEPFYDYNPETGNLEPPFHSERNITVQAVDNLPNELPKDASEDFGRNLIDKVFPGLLNDEAGDIIERATIAKNGVLTPGFKYLYEFTKGTALKNA